MVHCGSLDHPITFHPIPKGLSCLQIFHLTCSIVKPRRGSQTRP